ncbi:MAG TPA: DNA polymerase Y family protein [Chitinophagaceae bacterium]|nr:DNA polymerase Y family protein [Chitinophagaceae bacterium]
MQKRFVAIYFPWLVTDYWASRQPSLAAAPFVVAAAIHGRKVITAANLLAERMGMGAGTVVADARAMYSALEVIDDDPGLVPKLLHKMAHFCIRFTPVVAVDNPDGLLFDASGCAHLWGGDECYLAAIKEKFAAKGFQLRLAMADTIGAAWALARCGKDVQALPSGKHIEALMPLPPEALRLSTDTTALLHKLGLQQIQQFVHMPRTALRRRFGKECLLRLDQAIGRVEELITPLYPPAAFQERLPCLEPIATRGGIEIALQKLLDTLCKRLYREQKGLRQAAFICYRTDGKIMRVSIGTHRASCHAAHLFALFCNKIDSIEPAEGIELFILEAPLVEEQQAAQESLWEAAGGMNDIRLAELIDRLTGKLGAHIVHRYLPEEHYWPERSFKPAAALEEAPSSHWRQQLPRPLHLLPQPAVIMVTAPIPDYPPMLFRYQGILHSIVKADGPERIEQEWWLQEGEHRDYYAVENEKGERFWLFRSGHYDTSRPVQWFLHGFFT